MGGTETGSLPLEALRQVVDGISQQVQVVDHQGRLLYANPSAREFFGDRVASVGEPAFAGLDEPMAAVLKRSHREGLELREPDSVELEIEIGGRAVTLQCTRLPLFDRDRVVAVCTIATASDDSSLEHELALTLGQLRSMIEAFDDVLMLVNPRGEIQFINYTVTERTPEQVVGRSLYDYVDPVFHEPMRKSLERVVANREPDSFTVPYVASGGGVTFWESRLFPIESGDRVDLVTVVASNITERRAREEEQKRFFQISDDILCIIDAEGCFKRVNPAVKRILGLRPGELIGEPFLDWVHPDDREATLEILQASLDRAPGESSEFVNRYRHADGGYRYIAWRGVVDPETGTAYGIGRDVTERMALEEKLRQSQKLEAVGQLAGGIAHDFNNIALSILLNAELGLRHSSAEVVPKSFREIRDAAQRAADLTRQLLAFSRQTVVNFEYLDVNHVAEGVILLLRRLIPETISVDFIRGDQLPAVRADRGQLEQVLMNLCLNARDAMAEGGRIEIETRAIEVSADDAERDPDLGPGSYVQLSVADTGTGIDSAVIGRIFEPFFTTKPPGSGTGLGLATVYGIIQQHDAAIRVDTEPGTGTRFVIHLPASARRVTRTVEPAALEVHGGSETILLAEDDALVRAVVVRTLTEAGYAVLVARDGAEALELVEREEAIELVLLDMVMPVMSGVDAYARIREIRPEMRFLFSSGYVGASPHHDPREPPPPMIRKPYRPDDLLREIRRILDS